MNRSRVDAEWALHPEPSAVVQFKSPAESRLDVDLRSSPKRYMSLDHWRGIACLMIVLTHATVALYLEDNQEITKPANQALTKSTSQRDSVSPKKQSLIQKFAKTVVWTTSKMHFGVELFFVISGYCIAASAESLRRSGGTMGGYFRRRFVRIYPPFWCVLALSVAFCFACEMIKPGLLGKPPWVLAMPWDLSAWQWVGSLTLSGTWIGYVSGEPKVCYPFQSWTLSYEEQFYAVMGLVFACSGRWFFQSVAIVTAAIAAIDLSALYFQFSVRGFFFDEHWLMFAAGAAVYWTLNCATPRQAIAFNVLLVLAIASLGTTTFIFGSGTQFNAWRIVGSWCFAGLLIFLRRYDERIAAARWLGWLKSCGVMCYSIYLAHLFPVKLISQSLIDAGYADDVSISFICLPSVIVTSVALGYLFHVFVERRFLSSKINETSSPESQADRSEEAATIPLLHKPNWLPSVESPAERAA